MTIRSMVEIPLLISGRAPGLRVSGIVSALGIRLKTLFGEKGITSLSPTRAQSIQVKCFGIFFRRILRNITATVIQPAVILIFKIFKNRVLIKCPPLSISGVLPSSRRIAFYACRMRR